jgi:HEAT repeat protein
VAEIRRVANVTAGGRLPASKPMVEDKLRGMQGIEDASLEAACCETGKVILYIGVLESGGPQVAFHDYPTDSPDLPEPVSDAYKHFLGEVNEATRAGATAEDLTQGHSLLSFPAAREAQAAFVPLANEYAMQLRDILRRSAESDHRAMAAYVLGYHADKKEVLEDLAYALHDPDPTVRSNAARALAAIAVYAKLNPAAGVIVKPDDFIELLNSAVWSDRNNSAIALVTLTESRPPELLKQIYEAAMPSIVEMAKWKHAPHALSAYILLGRIAGIKEAELQEAWSKGERGRIIAQATSSGMKSGPQGSPK